MLVSLPYIVFRRLLRVLAPSDRSLLEREAELLVLRHQSRFSRAAVPQTRSNALLLKG